MKWENITSKNFKSWVDKSGGVCLLPLGVIEKHGNHLPLGTDMFSGTAVCNRAAEVETAVVFPYYFLGQIAEARHYKGTISASHRLIMDSLLEMCDEIHRSGFHKIIVASSHGGNSHFIPFFLQEFPGLNRQYSVYTCFTSAYTHEQREIIQKTANTTDLGGHAGLTETSLMMYLHPELVHPEDQDISESASLDRFKELDNLGVYSGFSWYAKFPYHIAGDHTLSTPELGKMLFDMQCENLVKVIRAVKADNVSLELIKEHNMLGRRPK